MAFLIPLALLSDCLVKKETVKGIIGKTQGVSKAKSPPTKPSKKILKKLPPSSVFSLISPFKSSLF